MGDLTKNFSKAEFQCECGCGDDRISEYLVRALQNIRDAVGPLSVSSGVRCKDHNASIGSKANSAHVPADIDDGGGIASHAVDIKITGSPMRFKFLKEATKYFTRIGVGDKFIHVDNDLRKPQSVMWHYYK